MPKRPTKKRETMSPELRTFGRNFKIARLANELRQLDIVQRTGLSESFISRLEQGKKNVSINTAVALSKSVGRSLLDLLSDGILVEKDETPRRAPTRRTN